MPLAKEYELRAENDYVYSVSSKQFGSGREKILAAVNVFARRSRLKGWKPHSRRTKQRRLNTEGRTTMRRMKRLISTLAMPISHTRSGGCKGPSMRERPQVRKRTTAFALGILSLVFCLSARADNDGPRAREAGAEDGTLCCGGRMPFLFDGDEVLAMTGRPGFFRSENRGAGWERSMEGFVAPNGVSPFVDSRCQAPSRPRIVYALGGAGFGVVPFNGLYSSNDFGRTWTRRVPVATGFGNALCAVDAGDPHTVYVATADDNFVGQLWKSTDGGQTLQAIGADLPAYFGPAFLWSVRGTLYLQPFAGDVYASIDGGASFHAVPVPPGVPPNFIGGFDASPDGHAIFVSTTDGFGIGSRTTGIFRSTDGGASYAAVSGLAGLGTLLGFDPTDPRRIYASSDGLLHVSTDGGLTFALLPASNDPRFLGPFPVKEISVDRRGSVYLSTIGGPFRTDDGGQTFRSLLNGFRASTVQDLAFDADGKLLVGVFHTQTVFQQTHEISFRAIGNTPFIRVNGNNDGVSVAGSPTDANVVLVATDNQGLLRTDNGGLSWTPAAVPGSPTSFSNSRMAFATGSRVYLVAPDQQSSPGLYRSDDAGRTFAHLSSLPFGAIAVDPTNPDVIYVGTYNSGDGLFKSTDGGQTLQDLGQHGAFSALAVDHRYPHVVYAGQRSGQVIRSLDGGHTFAPASNGLSGAGVHGLAQDAHGTLFVWLRGGGLFASDEGAFSWHAVDTGEALRRSGVEFGRGALVVDPRNPGRVYLGNAGVIQIDAGDDRISNTK